MTLWVLVMDIAGLLFCAAMLLGTALPGLADGASAAEVVAIVCWILGGLCATASLVWLSRRTDRRR